MKQYEYLRELEENLKSQISPEELRDILSDYEGFFISGREEGKSDDEISEELGSPAYLSKLLLGEHTNKGTTQQEINKNLANPGRRLCAYIIDAIIAVIPSIIMSFSIGAFMFIYLLFVTYPSPAIGVTFYTGIASFSFMRTEQNPTYTYRITNNNNDGVKEETVYRNAIKGNNKPVHYVAVTSMAILALIFYLFYSLICTLIFKGQTIGKKIMDIKVQGSNTEPLTKGTIFYREFLGKILLNSIPIVPLISILTILLTKEHKALHDMLADTVVAKA